MEAARSAGFFMDDCVAVADAVSVALTEAVAEADQSIHDQSIHDPSIQYLSIPNSKSQFSESKRQVSDLPKEKMASDGLI